MTRKAASFTERQRWTCKLGTLTTEGLERYRDRPETMLDQSDMYFEWSDMSFVMDYAYLSSDNGGIPIYLDPLDSSTLVGHYFSGVKVSSNITYNEWSSIYFGDDYSTGIKGYVQSEFLVVDDDAVTPGIPVARVNGEASESIDVRVRPNEASTVWAVVAGQDDVLVIGEVHGWYQIAREEDYGMRVIGYVPVEALSLTEERVSMH